MSFVKEGEKGMFASNRDDRKGYDKLVELRFASHLVCH